MEVLNISIDENEADTSCDELDEDPDFGSLQISLPRRDQASSKSREYSKLFRKWERPRIPEGTLLYSSSPVQAQPEPFRFLFLDSVSSVSKIKHPSIRERNCRLENASLRPVMRLFGVARVPVYSASQDLFDEPNFMNPSSFDKSYSVSVCCNVHGFNPYFYALPTIELFLSEHICDIRETIMTELNKRVCLTVIRDSSLTHLHEYIERGHEPVVDIEFFELKEVRDRIFHFPPHLKRNDQSLVLSVVVSLPMFVSVAAREMNSLHIKNEDIENPQYFEFDIYENNLTNNLRFLTDQNIPGCIWLELLADRYYHRTDDHGELERESHCQIELDVHYKDIIKLEQQPDTIPPLRVLSLDLESRVNTQKLTKKDGNGISRNQIIQIGAVLATYGAPGDTVIGKVAFVLGTCDPLPDAKVLQFYDSTNPKDCSEENLLKSEAVMLAAFRDFVIQMDPDIITGYNIKNFDLPYLISRAERYYYDEVQRFPYLGRLKKVKASVRPIVNKNKRMYGFDHKIVNIQGRIVMDMYPLFNRHKIENTPLKLKDVAKKYLQAGEEKDDVKYTEINGLQNGTSKTRNRLAKYCVQDSYLPVKLMLVHLPDRKSLQINFVQYYFQQARLCGTIFRYLVNKSKDYNKYFKEVRVQKNAGRVKYHPDTPSPKKIEGIKDKLAAELASPQPKPSSSNISRNIPKPGPNSSGKQRHCSRMLFTDED